MNVFHGVQPNRSDTRGFVHKRIGGAIVGGVKGLVRGGPGGVIGGAVTGFVAGGAPAPLSPFQQRIAREQAARVSMGRSALVGGGAGACPPGFNRGPGGGCVAAVGRVPGVRGFLQRVIPGGATGFEVGALPVTEGFPPFLDGAGPAGPAGTGQAVVGRFGAGIEPAFRSSTVRDCPRGMVLAVDSLCYNRRDLRNSERFWPRGRRPLLTGGEMRAISTAASAARKLQRKQKDLQELGLLPKPTARRKKGAVPGHKASLTHT